MSIEVARSAAGSAACEQIRFLVAEESDDALSVRSKLEDLPNQRIALIIPDINQALDSPIALRVLARAAERDSIDLAIVTSNRRLRHLATIEGLMTFRSVGDVPRPATKDNSAFSVTDTIRSEISRRVALAIPWVITFAFAGLILLGFALVIPREVVNVRPVTDQLSGSVQITAADNVSAPDPAHGMLPGRTVYFAVDSSGTASITPKDHLLDGRAVGFVTLQNQTNQ